MTAGGSVPREAAEKRHHQVGYRRRWGWETDMF